MQKMRDYYSDSTVTLVAIHKKLGNVSYSNEKQVAAKIIELIKKSR